MSASGAAQTVVIADVAVCAQPRRNRVHAGQRKTCAGVVEDAIGPEVGVMAGCARGRKARRDVVHRAERGVVIVLVAGNAGRIGDGVVVVEVAIGALPWWNRVIAGQREAGAVVVESRVQPRRRAMTRVARLGEVCCHVVRIRRSLKILEVAIHAGSAVQGVVVVSVAIAALARWNRVQSG